MNIEYDKEADAAYIYVVHPIKAGQSSKQVKVNEDIILDFDKQDRLLGIEVLDASKRMHKKVLLEADLL